MQHLQKTPGVGGTGATPHNSETRHSPFYSSPFLSHSCALFLAFLHSPKSQLVCFQSIPHSMPKTPGGGVPPFAESPAPAKVSQRNLSRPCLLTSLHPYFLTSLLPETATPFPQRWSCCEKGAPSSGEKTVRWKIQFPGGGGGASVTPLNLCMCIPWLPIVTV